MVVMMAGQQGVTMAGQGNAASTQQDDEKVIGSVKIASYKWSASSNGTLLKTIVGAFAIFAFLAVWISSLASPFILYASIRYQRYAITSVILVIFTCAYVPWEKGLFSKVFTAGVRLNVYYYKKCTQIFMGASLPSRGEEDGPKKNHKPKIYGVHPHGVFCLGWSILFCSPLMASVRFIFAPVLYASPFFRLWSRLTGNPGSADKASMIEYMKRREHLAIPPGGFEEATLSSPSHDRVYIKKRAGFVKLALQHGYNLVPVYVFGENKTYFNVQGGWKARLSLNSYSIPAIMAYGLSFFPILPRRNTQGLYIVVGDQLELPWIENPSREDVNHWHKLYISALVKLFDEHKVDAYGKEEGAEKKKLELW